MKKSTIRMHYNTRTMLATKTRKNMQQNCTKRMKKNTERKFTFVLQVWARSNV
jgi:hypothetical protein